MKPNRYEMEIRIHVNEKHQGCLWFPPAPSSPPDLLPLPLLGPGKLLVISNGFNGSFSPKPF